MKNILRIIKISRPLYRLIGLIASLILTGAVLQQVAPVLSKFIVDEIVLQIQTGDGDVNKLAILIGASFGFSLLGIVISFLTERLGDRFAAKLQKYLTQKFYSKVLSLPQSYFDSEISGKIVNQLSRGIITIKGFANTSTNFILPTFLQSVFTVAVLAYFNVPVAIFVFALFPIYLVISYISAKRWGEEEKKKNKLEDIGRGRITEVIGNIKLVKSSNNEQNEFRFISKNQSAINRIYSRQSRIYHFFNFLRNLSLILVLLVVNIIVFISAFEGNMSIGDMVLIIQLVVQARRPLFAMSFILTQIQNTESGSKEFFEVLDLESTEPFSARKRSYKKLETPTIEFKDVAFKYKDSDQVLNKMSFKLDSREKVALVGHSGAGKTTIINLILRLYRPTSGEILLDDQAYGELDHQFIRSNISLVFQENELFSSTVRENVAYGKKLSDKKIIRALKQANAYNFVKKLPKGLKSEIGERGIKLSGGQKQRIQIARAILDDAPILILDEATSNLDSRSEQLVQDALEKLMKEKLVIIIAHRFSTIQNVDRVIVLDKGRIADSGKPKDLSTKRGIYSDLLKYQIEGNKKLLQSFEIY
ncbi:MAG: ABC transporter ATP-binding protein [Candidatus Dojkabacteria bacterium]